MSPRKVRLLVTSLIRVRDVQDAIEILTFTTQRAAEAVRKTLKAAIANADENEADMDNLGGFGNSVLMGPAGESAPRFQSQRSRWAHAIAKKPAYTCLQSQIFNSWITGNIWVRKTSPVGFRTGINARMA
jgi:large subunit ribosomal protein L22